MLDLNRFMADELAGFVNMQADILRRHIHRVALVEDGIVRQVDDEIRIFHIFSLLFCRSGHTDRGRLIAAENSLDSGDKFF